MTAVLALASVLIIEGIILILRPRLAWRVCAICAGVWITWMGFYIARLLGYSVDATVIALLMGGTVVGIAYQLEKKLTHPKSQTIIKLIGIPLGFIILYSLLVQWWWSLFISIVIGGVVAGVIVAHESKRLPSQSSQEKEIEDKLADCC